MRPVNQPASRGGIYTPAIARGVLLAILASVAAACNLTDGAMLELYRDGVNVRLEFTTGPAPALDVALTAFGDGIKPVSQPNGWTCANVDARTVLCKNARVEGRSQIVVGGTRITANASFYRSGSFIPAYVSGVPRP